jgi:hypothetical protein
MLVTFTTSRGGLNDSAKPGMRLLPVWHGWRIEGPLPEVLCGGGAAHGTSVVWMRDRGSKSMSKLDYRRNKPRDGSWRRAGP